MVKQLHMLVFLLTWKSFTLAVLHPKYISGSSFLKNNLIWLYLSFDIWPIVKNKTCHLLIFTGKNDLIFRILVSLLADKELQNILRHS